MSHSKQEIIEHIYKVLVQMFEVEENSLKPEATLEEDLDLDSIDSIELLIELNDFVGKDVDASQFTDAKTINDMADIIIKIEQEI